MEKDVVLFYTWLSPGRQRTKLLLLSFMIYSQPLPGFLVHLKSHFVSSHFITGKVKMVRVFKQLKMLRVVIMHIFLHGALILFQSIWHLLNVFCMPGFLQDTSVHVAFVFSGEVQRCVKALRFSFCCQLIIFVLYLIHDNLFYMLFYS